MMNETIENVFDFAKKSETLPAIKRSAIVDIIHENLSLEDERIVNMIRAYLIEKNVPHRNVGFEEGKFAVHLVGTSYYFGKK
jgi:hypothetical protein